MRAAIGYGQLKRKTRGKSYVGAEETLRLTGTGRS